MSARISVLVVDDDPAVRSGLRELLGRVSGAVHVAGEAWDPGLAVAECRRLQPDVVLLDVRPSRRDGVSAAREIAALTRVLVTTSSEDLEAVREAVDAGAGGYLVHGSFDAADLVAAVRAVARGGGVFSASALPALRSRPLPAEPAERPPRWAELGLSARQGEILQLIAAGLSNGQIAERCVLAEKTVKNHVNRIFAALGVRHRGQAIAVWYGASLLGPGAHGDGQARQ